MKTLAALITENYDFPYARHCDPRTPAPAVLEPPRAEGRTAPAPANMLLGGYRCTRLGTDQKIPGITLLMRDSLSNIDWILDCFMEHLRMKCWVAMRKPGEDRSPYTRGTHPETLTRVLDAELTGKNNPKLLDHAVLRDILLGNSEAIPPTVELYLQAIHKLAPSSIAASSIAYGVSLAAMACVASDIPCSYNPADLSDEARDSLREFVAASGKKIREADVDADLIFIDMVPHGSHDMKSYNKTQDLLSYQQHIRRVVSQVLKPRTRTESPVRIALTTSLRELPAKPTVEPVLLSILASENIDLVGALVSAKRDYAVYLMMINKAPRPNAEQWSQILHTTYPELFSVETAPSSSLRPPTQATWDTLCLSAVLPSLLEPKECKSTIALQGPRKIQGKGVFPLRTRNCPAVSETHNTETGDIVYVFSVVADPLPPLPEPDTTPSIADPLISRMVTGIQQSIASESPE